VTDAATERRRIVVAHHGDGALRHVALDQLDDGDRVGAVPDEIAKEREALGSVLARVAQARLERRQIGVNVGEERSDHARKRRRRAGYARLVPDWWSHGNEPRTLAAPNLVRCAFFHEQRGRRTSSWHRRPLRHLGA